MGVSADKITVIYNGVDIDLYNPNGLSGDYQKEFADYGDVLKIGVLGRIGKLEAAYRCCRGSRID